MNPSARTFTLISLIVSTLLLMHQLPSLSVCDVPLRPVNLLSALLPEPEEAEIDVPTPTPLPPSAVPNSRKEAIHFQETWPKGVQPIVDYSAGKAGGMEHFYRQMAQIKALDRPVRIAYYGDSYIEGDILTGDLRELFQQTYGGSGVGWVDCGSQILQNRASIRQKCNGITEFAAAKKPFDKSRQGISERYFIPEEGAWAKTSGVRFHPHAARWTVSTLFFHTPTGLTLQATSRKGHGFTQTFDGEAGVQTAVLTDSTSSISYTFSHIGAGTSLFGMALESRGGVVLDNFSMRASPGLTLAQIPISVLKDFNRLRPYDLIILHFGLNIATPGNPLSVIRHYARSMERVVRNLKEAFPQTSILIMSVPDRDQRTQEGLRTMKEVRQLVAFQEQLAANTQVAFFNFYEAMGGAESVAALVERGMANKDYTHLNHKGGKELAQRIFPSFKAGIKNYQQRKERQK